MDPTPIPLAKVETEELHATHTIKVNIRRNPSQATLETYKINMSTFDGSQLDEFLALLRNFKITIDRTCMTMLRGTSLK